MRKIHLRHPTIDKLTHCGHQMTRQEYEKIGPQRYVNCKHCLKKRASKPKR